jgi:acyl carrier protein
MQAQDDLLQDIGDVQQHAEGMEREIDVMLARDDVFTEKLVTSHRQSVPEHVIEAPIAVSANAEEEVEVWVVDWLSKHRRIAVDEMNAQSTFVDIGLDSVSAVEFSFALQTWLGFEVDATVVWQHPTIGALSKFLMQEKAAKSPFTQKALASIEQSFAEDLSALSDAGLAKALAGELA